MTSAVPKLLALIFSLMLGGGYVWFRSGGSIPYLAPAKSTSPKPDRSLLPGSKSALTNDEALATRAASGDASDIVVPPEILERAERNQTFFSGSKSDRPFTTQDSIQSDAGDPAEPIFHSVDRDSRNQRVILGGSKSGAVEITSLHAIENLIAKPTPTPDPVTKYSRYRPSDSETADVRFLMPSSKTGAIHFEYGPQLDPKSEPKPQPQPQPVINNPKPQTPDAQTTVKRERTILPGSKSMRIEAPQPAPPAPAEKQTRTILPGSKSVIIRDPSAPVKAEENEIFETILVEEVETTGPDGKKVRTLLPGSKSAFQPIEPIQQKPAPSTTPPTGLIQPKIPEQAEPATKQQRTMLSGSKSQIINLPRLNPDAAKSQPTPGTDAGNRQSSIVNRPSSPPPEAPPAQSQQTEQKKRTLLPGSKSSGFSTERED